MPRSNYRQFRFTDQELSAYEALAKRANLPLATWVRESLNHVVHREQEKEHTAQEKWRIEK